MSHFSKGVPAPQTPPDLPVLPTEDEKQKTAPAVEVVNVDGDPGDAVDVDLLAEGATATEQLFREADVGHRARSPRRVDKPES